MIGLEVE